MWWHCGKKNIWDTPKPTLSSSPPPPPKKKTAKKCHEKNGHAAPDYWFQATQQKHLNYQLLLAPSFSHLDLREDFASQNHALFEGVLS